MRVTRLWWLLVPVAVLAACSSTDSGGTAQPAKAVGAAVETSTTVDPTTGFMNRLEVRLSGESKEFKQAAVDLSRSMCQLLDDVNGLPDGTDQAMATASATGLDPTVTAEVLRTGAEFFCPDYTQVVSDYFARQG